MNSYTHSSSMARSTRTGFTLIEIIVVVIIIGVLAAVIGPSLFGRIGQSKTSVAQSNAAAIASALKLYQADYGALPEGGNISALATRPTSPGGKGPYVDNAGMLKDPWGRLFILKVPGDKNFSFDVISYGADGKVGGDGENVDVIDRKSVV